MRNKGEKKQYYFLHVLNTISNKKQAMVAVVVFFLPLFVLLASGEIKSQNKSKKNKIGKEIHENSGSDFPI